MPPSVFPPTPKSRKTVLVTGGSGFIGSHVVSAFKAAGHQVRVLDLVPTDSTDCIVGDISDFTTVKKAMQGIDIVIHLAAQASVQKSLSEPELTRRSNVEGTRVVLEEAEATGCKKVVFASSCAVYGHEKPPLEESRPFQPLSLYAETKVAGEKLCQSYSQKGRSCVALRFFNVYGPGQKRDSHYAAVIPAFMHAARTDHDLTIYGDGKACRDFVFVGDVVAAIQKAADYSYPFGVFNIGSGKATTVFQLAEKIIALTGSSSKIVHAPGRNEEVRFSFADTGLAEQTLGFKAAVGLDEGLTRILRASR